MTNKRRLQVSVTPGFGIRHGRLLTGDPRPTPPVPTPLPVPTPPVPTPVPVPTPPVPTLLPGVGWCQ